MIHDVYGWTLPNLRLLADHYAAEAKATVYLPDFYDGGAPSPDSINTSEKIDVMSIVRANGKDKRTPEIFAVAKELRSKHKKVGAIGFCWGAWGCFKLAGRDQGLLDCVSVAHPSMLEKKEIENLAVPIQILAPEHDQAFTPELKEFAHQTIPKLGIDYDYQHFPGVSHGFAAKGNPKIPEQKRAFERAKNAAVSWFNWHLQTDE